MPVVSPAEQPKLARSLRPGGDGDFITGIERGMIFWARLSSGDTVGSEHCHDPDPCPWVILSSPKMHGRLPLVQVVPLSSKLHKAERHPYRILLSRDERTDYVLPRGDKGLVGDSLALTEQLRVFDHDRLIGNPVAKLSKVQLFAVEAGVKYVLDLD